MELHEKIKELRVKKKYSQYDMAELLQVGQSTYLQIEKGKTELTINRLNQIAKVLEVSIFEILDEEDKRLKAVEESYRNMMDNAAKEIFQYYAHIDRCFSVFNGILLKECNFTLEDLYIPVFPEAPEMLTRQAEEIVVECVNNGKRQYFFSLIGFAQIPSEYREACEKLYRLLKPFTDAEKLLLVGYEEFLYKYKMWQEMMEKNNSGKKS